MAVLRGRGGGNEQFPAVYAYSPPSFIVHFYLHMIILLKSIRILFFSFWITVKYLSEKLKRSCSGGAIIPLIEENK